MRRHARWLLVGGALAFAQCTLVVDTDGLADGPRPAPDAGAESGTDAGEEAGTDAGDAPDFVDTFDRPASDALGNGWTEKRPDAFRITGGGGVDKAETESDFRDNVVYRPADEDVRDVEVSVEVSDLAEGTYPQLILRGRRSTIGISNELDAYVFAVFGQARELVILRQRSSDPFVELATEPLPAAISSAERYRLVASARGTTRVELSFRFERYDEVDDAWETLQDATAVDDADVRLAEPGAVGFGGSLFGDMRYDVFTWRALR